ncbi:MAG: ATP-dependent helicase [Deltaproteobacteria bacterium]|nr:ATP-dependent helicase [Deltaproteobacteria bacterium]
MSDMQLTSEQQKAVTLDKSLAVVASAGTGKTTVLTQRFLHIHRDKNCPLYNILAFTFTEKASREMKERILSSGQIDIDQVPQVNISTIHSFCLEVLRQHGAAAGLKSDLEIMDDAAFLLFADTFITAAVKKHLDENNKTWTTFLKYYGLVNLRNTVLQLIRDPDLSLRNKTMLCINKPDEVAVQTLTDFLASVSTLAEDFLKQRVSSGQVTYDDLETLTLRLLETNPDVQKKLQKRFKHILVDEYQDVSPAQFELINRLFNPEINTVFIVGDPKQSIYRFRKADSRLFKKMADMIINHGGETIYLTKTFRTPESLQSYFNKVFPKVVGNKIYKHGHTDKQDPDSIVYAHEIPDSSKNREAQHESYAQAISKIILGLKNKGTTEEQIALLFFARGPMRIYQGVFLKNGIDAVIETHKSYFEEPLTLVAWHIMNYLAGARDKITQIGILRSPLFCFSESFIDHLNKSESSDLFSGQTLDLFTPALDKNEWTMLCYHLSQWNRITETLSAAELFDTIIRDLKPIRTINETMLAHRFCNTIRSFEKQGLYYLHETKQLINRLEMLDSVTSATVDEPKGIRLLTIHGAKGLEFDHVFLIPGAKKTNESPLFVCRENEGFIFKTHDCEREKTLQYQLDETEDYQQVRDAATKLDQEELTRLVYVALTRAKKSLYFFPTRPSQAFMNEMEKRPENTAAIKDFNEWLYWLSNAEPAVLRQMPSGCHSKGYAKAQDHAGEDGPLFSDGSRPHDATPSTAAHLTPLACSLAARVPFFTVTEIETFAQCPKRFELRYLKRIRPIRNITPLGTDPKPQTKTRISPVERGNVFHEVLQNFDCRENVSLDDVIDQALFNHHIIEHSGSMRTEINLLFNKLKSDPLFREILFNNLESHEEIEFSTRLESFILTGQIDKLIKTKSPSGEKKWVIIDFKTHHISNTDDLDRLTAQFSFQMKCYALAVCRRFNISKTETMIIFTNGPTYRVREHTAEALKNFEADLKTLYTDYSSMLAQNKFSLTKNKTACEKCLYYQDNTCMGSGPDMGQ